MAGYFPITVRFTDTLEETSFQTPSSIPSGRQFVVIKISKKT